MLPALVSSGQGVTAASVQFQHWCSLALWHPLNRTRSIFSCGMPAHYRGNLHTATSAGNLHSEEWQLSLPSLATNYLHGEFCTVRSAYVQVGNVSSMDVDRKTSLLEQSPACTLDYASEGSESSAGDCSEMVLEVCTFRNLHSPSQTQYPHFSFAVRHSGHRRGDRPQQKRHLWQRNLYCDIQHHSCGCPQVRSAERTLSAGDREGPAKRSCHAAHQGPLGSPRSSRQRRWPAGGSSKAWWLGPTALAGECFQEDFTLIEGGDGLLGRGTFGSVRRWARVLLVGGCVQMN